MSLLRKNKRRKLRKLQRVRKKFKYADSMRVSVFRSAEHIYAQLIDDRVGHTVASSSTLQIKEFEGNKTAYAYEVGKKLAEKAKSAGISRAVFDRGSFKFHGRVKALAQGLCEAGLQV